MSIRDVYRWIGRTVIRSSSARLSAGRSIDGGALPRKRVDDGRPLGVSSPGGGLFAVLRQGVVVLRRDGLRILWPGDALQRFDQGDPTNQQPPRRIVGLAGPDAVEAGERVLGDLEREAVRLKFARRRSRRRR